MNKIVLQFAQKHKNILWEFKLVFYNPKKFFDIIEKDSEIKQVIRNLCMMNKRFMNFMLNDNKKAVEKAAKEKNIEFAKGLLADGMSIEFTVRHSKLSEAEVRELASKLSA